LFKDLDQRRFPRQLGRDSQLDRGIVCAHEDEAGGGKCL
jgi:hypothetical protein